MLLFTISILYSCKDNSHQIQTSDNNLTNISSTVTMYFKDSDSTINETFTNYRVDLNNKGWIEFLTDFRQYFFSGIKQPQSRYQVQATINGVVQNTQLNIRFTDIAFIAIQNTLNNAKYTITCPENPNKIKDQYCTLFFYNSGKIGPYITSYQKGLSNMTLYFETRYLTSKPKGRYEYVMKTGCEQITHQLLLDWKFIKGIQLHTNNNIPYGLSE